MTDIITLVQDGSDCEQVFIEFENLEFGVSFPIEWGFCNSDGLGGTTPEDPGTIYFTVGVKGEEIYENGVTVSITLKEILEEYLDGVGNNEKVTSDEHVADAQKLIAEFRARADWLESKLAPPISDGQDTK